MKTIPSGKTLQLVMAVLMASCPSADAVTQVVWRIGKFDKSSLEFSSKAPWTGEQKDRSQYDMVYIIGKNHAEDWPGSSRVRRTGWPVTGRTLTPSNSICPLNHAAYTR